MRPLRLSRRSLLRGAGSVAIALPWLEAMEPVKESRAAGASAKRFVAVYTPGGTILEKFRPLSQGTLLSLSSPILAPLRTHEQRLVVLQGLASECAAGSAREAGTLGWLTGATQASASAGALSPSFDQALAQQLGGTPLYQAVRFGTARAAGASPEHGNVASYRLVDSALQPVLPELDPVATWQGLFGSVPGHSSDAFRKSVLDSVLTRYQRLSQQLGSGDRLRLEAHMDQLRALELRVASTCPAVPRPNLGAYDPRAFERPSPATDAAIPEVGRLMMELLVVALSCDLKQVAILQWADSAASYSLPWLDLAGNETHAAYAASDDYRPSELEKIFTWYSTQHAFLLDALANVDVGGHSLLDETVVFFGSEAQSAVDGSTDDMPFLLAGGGGGLVGDRFRDYGGRPHNDLLAALFNLFGERAESYGDAAFNTEPLGDLASYG